MEAWAGPRCGCGIYYDSPFLKAQLGSWFLIPRPDTAANFRRKQDQVGGGIAEAVWLCETQVTSGGEGRYPGLSSLSAVLSTPSLGLMPSTAIHREPWYPSWERPVHAYREDTSPTPWAASSFPFWLGGVEVLETEPPETLPLLTLGQWPQSQPQPNQCGCAFRIHC